jgi:hypothetical protein
MLEIGIHYPLAGLIVLISGVVLVKGFRRLTAWNARRRLAQSDNSDADHGR